MPTPCVAAAAAFALRVTESDLPALRRLSGKSGGAGASSSKRKRRSKGDDSSEEEARDEEEAPEEEPADSSTADADDGRAFEGALLTLNVLTLPQVPRELFIEERVEGVLQASAHARARDRPAPAHRA